MDADSVFCRFRGDFVNDTGILKMELDALFSPEYVFFMKMALVACVVVVVGLILRKRPASPSRQ